MTPQQKKLELNGTLHEHPLAELLVEIAQANLNGSLRLSNAEHKIIIYFDAGDIIFAISNARQHRLFNLLLREEKITTQELTEFGNFTNDLELKEFLVKENRVSENEIKNFLSRQIEEILHAALDWKEGKWNFTSLVRAKGDLRFPFDARDMIFDYARHLPNAAVVRRFKSLQETFEMRSGMPVHINLHPQEAFIFSRFAGGEVLSIEEVKNSSGLSEMETIKTLYVLWMGGFLKRLRWDMVFTPERIFAISSAKLALKKPDVVEKAVPKAENESQKEEGEKEKAEKEKLEIFARLEAYLERVENAGTLYEILDVSPDASTADIKAAYFSLAKNFHPDLFYRQAEAAMYRRIQHAFTGIAHAYETLKNDDSREVYDFKLGKEMAYLRNRTRSREPAKANMSDTEKAAAEHFEQGFSYLMGEDYEQAIPLLARSVHLNGNVARYHAYYAKALASDEKTYRQAEAEFQAALRLDANNTDYRLMLADLYVKIGLFKRAEGELVRLLEKAPGNREARALLDSLRKK